jgi:D-alanine-D-alanine ligase
MRDAMKVLILRNHVPLPADAAHDLTADLDVIGVADGVKAALDARGHETRLAAVSADDLFEVLLRHDPREWFVFHLIEGMDGRSRLEPYALAVYESLGFTSTAGPCLAHYNCTHKHRAKQILRDHAIATPDWQIATSAGDDLHVRLPAIVKPIAEDASIGIPHDAVAATYAEVRDRVALIVDRHEQPAIVEEFIDGREVTVGLWGNSPVELLPLTEVNLDAVPDPLRRILSYEAKWREDHALYSMTPPVCPALLPHDVTERVRALALAAFRALGCRDYAHADIRIRDGQPYLIDMNPACDLSEDLGFARQASVAGHSYPETIERIARFAHDRMRAAQGMRRAS